MPNSFYSNSGAPATGSALSSATMRAEFTAIEAGFDKLPTLAGNANKIVVVDAGGNALNVVDKSLPAGALVGTTDAQTLTNKTIDGASNTISNISVAAGGTGRATLTANNVILGNGTSSVNFVAPGTSGNVLTSNGTTWTSAAAPAALTGATLSASPYTTRLGVNSGSSLTGTYNVAIGYNCANSTATSQESVFIGYGIAAATTQYKSYGVYIGSGVCGTQNFNTSNETIIGYQACYNGVAEVAVGANAGRNYRANRGTFFGKDAGYGVVAGTGAHDCVAVGSAALYSFQTGSDNSTAVGNFSLYAATTGGNNTSLGYSAGRAITSGASNTLIGCNSGYSGTNNLTTGSNNTIIGYNAASSSATISNEITLGNSSIATIRAQVTTITALSDARDKTDIETLNAGLDFVKKLRPVRFTWAMRDGGKVREVDTGFIAQDLKAIQEDTGISIPGLVYESNPDRLEAGYGKLLPVLVKAIQDLSAEVESLKTQLEGKNV